MFALDKFLDHHVEGLLAKYHEHHESDPLPIDIEAIARIAGVDTIEEREMIAEAILKPRRDDWTILSGEAPSWKRITTESSDTRVPST